jgi:hypothetical protein
MLEQIEGKKVLSLDDGNFIVRNEHYQMVFTRPGCKTLMSHLASHLANTSGGPRQVLLIGGPFHGEWRDLPPEVQYAIQLHICEPMDYTAIMDRNPSLESIPTTTHVYTKASDIQAFGVRLPFEIYEHQSLCGANKARRIRQLDEELGGLDASLDLRCQEVIMAKGDVERASTRLANAQTAHDKTAADYKSLADERLRISYETGL